MTQPAIRTPDQRLRIFVSSTIAELAPERAAVRAAIQSLRLAPVLFEMGARPHPPRDLYRAYLAQSDVFIGIYWQSYGWVAPGEEISGLEDEYRLSHGMPRLIYIKEPAPERQERLKTLVAQIRDGDTVSYQKFETPGALAELVANDLALMLTERFDQTRPGDDTSHPVADSTPPAFELPSVRGPLIGREAELGQVTALLRRQDVGLVTLSGPGGSGKSRLALQAAAEVADAFAEGVAFVPLAPIRDSALVPATIAQAFGLQPSGTQPVEEILKGYFRSRHQLVVLDNVEQVVEAASFFAALLEAAPRLHLLVTSRVPLRLRAEHEVPVPPLNLERHGDALSPAEELFVLRAREVRPDLQVSGETRDAIGLLAARLDGLPLALELAAARVRVLSPQQMLARMTNRLGLLEHGARDLPERQRTLRGTIAWSYDLLDAEAKRLFRHLAVFRGGWTLNAAEAVCGGEGRDILGGLEALLENSLIRQDPASHEPRYTMFETIHEFAQDQLAASGEEEQLRRRHAELYLQIAESHWAGAISRTRNLALAELTAERDNLRAALEWSVAHDPEIGGQLAGMLAWYWYFTASALEGKAWSEALQPKSEGMSPAALGWFHWCAGMSAINTVGLAPGVQSFAAAFAAFEEAGLDRPAAGALTFWGLSSLGSGDHEALDRLERAVEHARSSGDIWILALTLCYLAEARLAFGDVSAARTTFKESVDVARSLEDPWILAISLNAFAECGLLEGDTERAIPAAEESIRRYEEASDQFGRNNALVTLAELTVQAGDVEQARELFIEACRNTRNAKRADVGIRTFVGLARLALGSGDTALGVRLGSIAHWLQTRLPGALWPTGTAIIEQGLAEVRAAAPDLWERQLSELEQRTTDDLFSLGFAEAERLPGQAASSSA